MKDGEMGFPGNLDVKVIYSIDNENGIKIHYVVKPDRPALINMTNHSYFNLAGHDAGTILDHVLTLNCSKYTPVVEGAIPTGELATVTGTPLDFLKPAVIGDRIEDDCEQLKLVQGYDHNFCIDNADGTVRLCATVDDPKSGRHMDVYTDQPGVQFYAGNCTAPETGKNGASYGKRTGLCLESQVYPNSINQAGFPESVYTPDAPYDTVTIYSFSAK